MSHLFGVGLNIETNRILNEFRMHLQKKKGIALRALSLALYSCGPALSSDELEQVLASFNIFPTKVHLQTLMKAFDQDGCLSVDAFMAHLRPQLDKRRAAVCDLAWARIDAEGAGCVSVDRLQECYDVSLNADYIEGTMTKEQIFESFKEGLSYNGQAVSQVRKDQEWAFYHQDLSLTIVDDEYFVGMTGAVWGVREDPSTTVSKQEIEHLVKMIRKRVLDLSSVNQSAEAVLRAIYREVDGTVPPTKVLTSTELS